MAGSREYGATFRSLFDTIIHKETGVNIASLADGAGATQAVTVTGAALGDFVLVSFELDLQDITVTAYVSAANTVEIRVQNESGGVIDLAAATVNIVVLQPGRLWDRV